MAFLRLPFSVYNLFKMLLPGYYQDPRISPLHISQKFSPLTTSPDPSDPPTTACWLCLFHEKKRPGTELFPVTAPRLWNSLPETVRQAESVDDYPLLFSGF
ncbi:hypothetical protein LDENG_00295240 [Lucifuga dentata]|nr:hypothetical protein LDENG_00295240 [Lucifuga dentata]